MRKIIAIMLIAAVSMTAAMAAVNTPDWVGNWGKYYPDSRYICAVGYGTSRDLADKSAFENLATYFGVSVSSYTETSMADRTLSADGRTLSYSTDGMQSQAAFSVNVSNLVHTVIAERWNEGREYISLAVMDKVKAVQYYLETAKSYAEELSYYSTVDPASLTFDSYYAVISLADYAASYREYKSILSVIAPGMAAELAEIPGDPEIRRLVLSLSNEIGLSIDARDDDWYLVEDEVVGVLNRLGITPMGNGTRYVLTETLSLERTELPGNPLKFINYSLVLRLKDTYTNKYIFTWRGTGREGQTTYATAQNRAITALDKKIRNDFLTSFSEAFNLTPLYN